MIDNKEQEFNSLSEVKDDEDFLKLFDEITSGGSSLSKVEESLSNNDNNDNEEQNPLSDNGDEHEGYPTGDGEEVSDGLDEEVDEEVIAQDSIEDLDDEVQKSDEQEDEESDEDEEEEPDEDEYNDRRLSDDEYKEYEEFKKLKSKYGELLDNIDTIKDKAFKALELEDEFKELKPFIKGLKESGIVKDKDKFNIAVEAMKGNKDAILKLLKEHDIDPTELDTFEDKDIEIKDNTTSDVESAYQDMINTISSKGVEQEFMSIFNTLNDDDILDVVNNREAVNVISDHVKAGVHKDVIDAMKMLSLINKDGYSNKSFLEKYDTAQDYLLSKMKHSVKGDDSNGEVKDKTKPKTKKKSSNKKIIEKVKSVSEKGNTLKSTSKTKDVTGKDKKLSDSELLSLIEGLASY